MNESKEMIKLYKDFEKKYGLDLVKDLKLLMSRIYQKVTDLEHSRDKWKKKYMELKK